MTFDVQVRVWLKPSVFDPQGNAVEQAAKSVGYDGVHDVRIGKYMEFQVDAETEADASMTVTRMCEEILHNPVMETYAFTLKAGVSA